MLPPGAEGKELMSLTKRAITTGARRYVVITERLGLRPNGYLQKRIALVSVLSSIFCGAGGFGKRVGGELGQRRDVIGAANEVARATVGLRAATLPQLVNNAVNTSATKTLLGITPLRFDIALRGSTWFLRKRRFGPYPRRYTHLTQVSLNLAPSVRPPGRASVLVPFFISIK